MLTLNIWSTTHRMEVLQYHAALSLKLSSQTVPPLLSKSPRTVAGTSSPFSFTRLNSEIGITVEVQSGGGPH